MMLKEQPTLKDCQQFHRWLDKEKGFTGDLPTNVMLLVEEVGEVAKEVRRLRTWSAVPDRADDMEGARLRLEEELADCLAYIAKLANYADIDLERAYVDKMRVNVTRVWKE